MPNDQADNNPSAESDQETPTKHCYTNLMAENSSKVSKPNQPQSQLNQLIENPSIISDEWA